ncbi:pyruvate kinase [Rubellicoccus peritrichatus]|uniref:Pyruvate kinase n=1 Tax=Rubellicoccus peritrichatus TaxID=3080537 RepID=A0AAQ3QRF7_9BACT|nr:pyruvate kinase [Puniceicoccus sp. CR14]WOO39331.1 pyruvate kinase [Puniceicoccus sp. CR14]
MKFNYRHTKIIFTIGPATASEETLEEVIAAGADICRLNMAHASHEWTREVVRRVRKVCDRVGRQMAIMMDVKGPEVRTGDLPEPIELEKGELFDFLVKGTIENDLEEGIRGVTVNYPGLSRDVKEGATLLVDSGLVRMEVLERRDDRVRCKVIIPGPMTNRRHINLPGVKVRLPALTEKDKADIMVGTEEGVELYALSFVREADDLDIFRRYLLEKNVDGRIIAKIEDQSAIANLDEIIQAADGLMVARGDLGIECPFEQLPIIQREAVRKCIKNKKPVIIATHMLESMIENPLPTRAEVTDVANAIYEKADCIMLSGETTTGKYPVESIRVMDRIARQIEGETEKGKLEDVILRTPKSLMLKNAVQLAQDLKKCGIVVYTRNGNLTRVLSSLRPAHCPIFAFTDSRILFKQLLMQWGVEPFMIEFDKDPEVTIRESFKRLKDSKHRWAKDGDWMVVVTNVIAGEKIIDSIQMRPVE